MPEFDFGEFETIEVTKKDVDHKALVKTVPKRGHYSRLIRSNTQLVLDGRVVAIYLYIPAAMLEDLRFVALNSEIIKSTRTGGLSTQSAVYGGLPRIAVRGAACRLTYNTLKHHGLHTKVAAFSHFLSGIYARYLPEEYERNNQLIQGNVEPDYILGDETTPFTTANFNINHAIRYHTDTGNFRGVYSNVLILKKGVVGGFLACPEFDLAFEQGDGALAIFDGQAILHGVTPIKKTHPAGYRCSTVFYALETMKHCYPFQQELEHVRSWRTNAEKHWRPPAEKLKSKTKE